MKIIFIFNLIYARQKPAFVDVRAKNHRIMSVTVNFFKRIFQNFRKRGRIYSKADGDARSLAVEDLPPCGWLIRLFNALISTVYYRLKVHVSIGTTVPTVFFAL